MKIPGAGLKDHANCKNVKKVAKMKKKNCQKVNVRFVTKKVISRYLNKQQRKEKVPVYSVFSYVGMVAANSYNWNKHIAFKEQLKKIIQEHEKIIRKNIIRFRRSS